MIDYKELLKKYINHVASEEGTTFIGTLAFDTDHGYKTGFSNEEVDELIELDKARQKFLSEGPVTRSPEYQKQLKNLLLEELKSMPSATHIADTPK